MEADIMKRLISAAREARGRAYAPYSGFAVGAAIMADSGEIFSGCNIENISYPAGMCAERTALFAAVAAGRRRFEALAVTGGRAGEEPEDFCMPCGMCLQVLSEFCGPELEICVFRNGDEERLFSLGELLPCRFDSLGKDDEQCR